MLIEGTTYLVMFDPDNYCLFRPKELEKRFAGWKILESRNQSFPAPGKHVQGFFDCNRGKTDSKELKSFSNDLDIPFLPLIK